MKKLAWYNEVGFFNNPFSIKPAAFHDELFGYDSIVKDINKKVSNNEIMLVTGEYGSGKTTILKRIINRFKGRRDVIYYNCNQSDKAIDFDRLLIGARGFFGRLFRVRKRNMILLLDEAQDMNKKDIKRIPDYYDDGFFRSVIFVTKEKDIKFTKELDELVGGNKFKLGKIGKTEAVRLVRKRVGNLKLLSDEVIAKIFRKNQNPRAFLKNCEDVCRYAVENGYEEVDEEHVKKALK